MTAPAQPALSSASPEAEGTQTPVASPATGGPGTFNLCSGTSHFEVYERPHPVWRFVDALRWVADCPRRGGPFKPALTPCKATVPW